MKRIIFVFALTALTVSAFADGPGPPPEIPVDGGIIGFLVAAGVAGAGLIGLKRKKKRN